MIVVISEKDFLHNISRLCKKGRYVVINTTDNDKISNLGAVSASDSFQILEPPAILTEKGVSENIKDKKIKGWLECNEAKKAIATIAFMQVSEGKEITKEPVNKNVFIVMGKKAYKHCAKILIRKMNSYFKLEEEDGPVCIMFTKAHKYIYGDIHDNIANELKRLDKKIDKLVDDLEYGEYDIFDDDDIHEREKKLKKLRQKRRKLAEELESNKRGSDIDEVSDDILCNCLKRGAVSKSARKKLIAFAKKFYEKCAINDYTTKYF